MNLNKGDMGETFDLERSEVNLRFFFNFYRACQFSPQHLQETPSEFKII